jgi:hypothetical protein
MKRNELSRALALIGCILAATLHARGQADDTAEYSTSVSPDGKYSLSATIAGSADTQSLILKRHGKEVMRYPFDSYFGPVYWSPSGKYVAVNNHYGHYAWNVWVLSLRDGSVITAHGALRDPKYNATLDYHMLPDVLALPATDSALKAIYPAYKSDPDERGGILTIAYGWKKGDLLEFYHRIVFPKLWDSKNLVGELLTESKITPRGIDQPAKIEAHLIPEKFEGKRIPPEAEKILEY